MSNSIITAGIACIVAAIVGGGLKAFGIEIPALSSLRRQMLLAMFGALLLSAQFAIILLQREATAHTAQPSTEMTSPAAKSLESEKVIELDPRITTEIGPFAAGSYKTLSVAGQWSTGLQQPYVGPQGSTSEMLHAYPKWAVIIRYVNPANGQVMTEQVYPGHTINLLPNLKLRLFVNDEPYWLWDNTNDPNDPLRVILRR